MHKKTITIKPIDNIILFGGGILIVEFAKEALNKGIHPYVFSAPRHLKEFINERQLSLEKLLRKERITFYQVDDINKSRILRSIVTERTIGIGLGEIYTFNNEVISLFKNGLFDFMVINLPEYRGGAHFTWQILRGDKRGCWNIQIINDKMIPAIFDSGEIVKKRHYIIPQAALLPRDYFDAANKEGLELFEEFLSEIKTNGEFKLCKLKEKNSSYFPRLYTRKNGFINWAWNTDQIKCFICSFDDPYTGASTFLDGKRVFIKKCHSESSDITFHPFQSGIIYRKQNNSCYIASYPNSLVVKEIFDDRGRSIRDRIPIGRRLYTPQEYIEEAMLYNAEYDSYGLK